MDVGIFLVGFDVSLSVLLLPPVFFLDKSVILRGNTDIHGKYGEVPTFFSAFFSPINRVDVKNSLQEYVVGYNITDAADTTILMEFIFILMCIFHALIFLPLKYLSEHSSPLTTQPP